MIFVQRLLGALIGTALLVIAFVFASVLLAVVAVAGLLLWGWLMWRTRDLRRAMAAAQTEVLEGEYRVEHEVQPIGEVPPEQDGAGGAPRPGRD